MAVPKIKGKSITDYFWYGVSGDSDPSYMPERLKEIAKHLREHGDDEDYDDIADDLDDAAGELEELLLNRISDTLEESVDYEK